MAKGSVSLGEFDKSSRKRRNKLIRNIKYGRKPSKRLMAHLKKRTGRGP